MAPLEKRTAALEMTLGVLSRVDDLGNRVLFNGSYSLAIGGDVDGNGDGTTVGFELVGEDALLDLWPQPPSVAGNGTVNSRSV